ncbi:MAG: TonB-dependent receptor domain-containing protein, partial [Steroidobacteraceae bacterium]
VQICPFGVPNAIGGCDGNSAPGAPPGQAFLFNNVQSVNRAAGGAGRGVSVYDGRYVPTAPYVNGGTGEEDSTLDLCGVSATLDWKRGAINLRSITAWRTFDAHFVRDVDMSPFDIVTAIATVEQQQFSEELQLFGAAGSRLDWLGGVYYMDEKADDDSDFNTASFSSRSGGQDIVSRSAAIYAQATWRVNEQIALTGGGRYTDEHRSYVPTQFFASSVTGQPPAGLVIVPAIKNELDSSRSTWRAALEYTPVDDLLVLHLRHGVAPTAEDGRGLRR